MEEVLKNINKRLAEETDLASRLDLLILKCKLQSLENQEK